MSIDYGLQNGSGIAVTDPLQIIANGLGYSCRLLRFLTSLKQYFSVEEVEEMVVGMPYHLDGNPTYLSPLIEEFIAKSQKTFSFFKSCNSR